VLAVSVDASGECIAVLVGVRVSRRDPCTKPAILAEREDLGSRPAAISTVRSVDPSSTRSTSTDGSPDSNSSRTSGRFSSSFQAGTKTTVSGTAPTS
jgi:hypothetical protein